MEVRHGTGAGAHRIPVVEVGHGASAGGGARRLLVVEVGHGAGGSAGSIHVVGQSLLFQIGHCHLYEE